MPTKKLTNVSEKEWKNDNHESEIHSSDMALGVADEAETTSKKEAGLRDCMPEAKPTNCTAQCCASSERTFQPFDK